MLTTFMVQIKQHKRKYFIAYFYTNLLKTSSVIHTKKVKKTLIIVIAIENLHRMTVQFTTYVKVTIVTTSLLWKSGVHFVQVRSCFQCSFIFRQSITTEISNKTRIDLECKIIIHSYLK